KKVCMLGAFGVGKTSLVKRYVESIYSDAYQTTVGVKVDSKTVDVGGQSVCLVLWDIYGEDDVQRVQWSYLRGASGYLLVADGTRPASLERAWRIFERIEQEVGHVPFVFLLNKSDLVDEWRIDKSDLDSLKGKGWPVLVASAKSGAGVERA